jgi:hypothetical protein
MTLYVIPREFIINPRVTLVGKILCWHNTLHLDFQRHQWLRARQWSLSSLVHMMNLPHATTLVTTFPARLKIKTQA